MRKKTIEHIETEPDFHTSRIASFSDAIFAFTITLMVVDLKPPDLSNQMNTVESIYQLFKLVPSFLGVLLSFFLVATYWKRHHQLFYFVTGPDSGFIWLNSVFMFSIVFVPFSISFYLQNIAIESPLPIILYNINFIISSILLYRLFSFVFNKSKVDRGTISTNIFKEIRYSIFVYAIVIIISAFNSGIAPLGYILFGFKRRFSVNKNKKLKIVEK